MKTIAAPVVSRVRKLPAPLLPKIVVLAPPKTAPMSAPLPACKRTVRTSTMHARTCTMVTRIIMTSRLLHESDDATERLRFEAGAAHEGTVDVRLRHEAVDILRRAAAAVKDPHRLGARLAGELTQEGADRGVHLLRLLGGRALAGAD